jgi:hypothetical protein
MPRRKKQKLTQTVLPLNDQKSSIVTDSWLVSCACGVHEENYDDGERMVECTVCLSWQHTRCVGSRISSFPTTALNSDAKGDYCCAKCTKIGEARVRAQEHWLVRAADSNDKEYALKPVGKVLPDDLYGRILEFLSLPDQAYLSFCVSTRMKEAVTTREIAWRGICAANKKWVLPSRPRKQWIRVYFEKQVHVI